MIERPRARHVACVVALAGCAPGHVTWDGGTDLLRTAVVQVEQAGDVHIASFLLSNSDFTLEGSDGPASACALPQLDDPSDQSQAIAALQTAACREGARHVTLRLYRLGGDDWSGAYEGRAAATAADLSEGSPRLVEASYYGVDEAFLVDLGYVDRAYAVTEDVLDLEVAEGGTVEIRGDGQALSGAFLFARESLQGDFRASICGDDTSLLDLLESTPSHLCP